MLGIRFSSNRRDIIDINRKAAHAVDGICIIELENMNALMDASEASSIRELFIKNQTPIRQLTNYQSLQISTDHLLEKMQQLMEVRHISKEIFTIKNEILIFGNTVAMYRVIPDIYYVEIEDPGYASMMRSLFENIWGISELMLWSRTSGQHAKQYIPFNMYFNEIPIVVYPARDDGDITQAFGRENPEYMKIYLDGILGKYKSKICDADMLILYVWNDNIIPMVDIWKVTRNNISDDSGFLYDGFTIRDNTIETSMGIASGNSLIVFTAEELLLRKLITSEQKTFLEASNREKYTPFFPQSMVPNENFFHKLRI